MNIGFIFSIGAAIVWGLVYTIDQKVLHNINPMTLLFINSVLTAIIVLPFLFFNNGSIKQALLSDKNTWVLIIATTALAALANFIFQHQKSQCIDSVHHRNHLPLLCCAIQLYYFQVNAKHLLFPRWRARICRHGDHHQIGIKVSYKYFSIARVFFIKLSK